MAEILWIYQLDKQLRSCIKLISLWSLDKSSWAPNKTRKRRQELQKALTVSYLNFKLFQFYLNHAKGFVEYITNLTNYVIFATNLSIYLIHRFDHDNNVRTPLLLILFFVFNVNTTLSLSMTDSARKLYSLINVLVGRASCSSICNLRIIQLWRSNLISDEDAQHLHSIRWLGFQVTRSKMLSLNYYAIAAFLYVNRKP